MSRKPSIHPVRHLGAARRGRSGLTPAERARSLVASASETRIGILNLTHEIPRHAVGSDGSLLFLAPTESPGGVFRVAPLLPPQVVTLTAVDVTSVPQRDRVRGTVRLSGTVGPMTEALPAGVRGHLAGPDPRALDSGGPVLRFVPTRVTLSWECEPGAQTGAQNGAPPGPVEVPIDEYRVAFPDPLLEYESQWLPHLHQDHAEMLRTLAASVCGGLADSVDVRPLGLDRYGLLLRVYAADARRDVRLTFGRPVTCGCELREAFGDLLERAAPGEPGFRC